MQSSAQLQIKQIHFERLEEICAIEEFLLRTENFSCLSTLKQEKIKKRISGFKDCEKNVEMKTYFQKNFFVVVAQELSCIYGIAMGYIVNDCLYLDTIIVDERFQDKGIEEQLLMLIHNTYHIPKMKYYAESVSDRLISGLHFVLDEKKSSICMIKSSEDFSHYSHNQSNNVLSLISIDKKNTVEVDRYFKIFDAVDTMELGADQQRAKKEYELVSVHAMGVEDNHGNPMGIILYKQLEDSYQITLLAVLAEYRRKGIAKFLIQAVQQKAFDVGIKKVLITVFNWNKKALNCYQSVGFHEHFKNVIFIRQVALDSI